MNAWALGRARVAAAVAGLSLVLCSQLASAQSLTITPVTAGDFGVVNLDGTSKSRTASIGNFSVTDSRLVSAGWNVTVTGTLFQRWDGFSYVSGNPFPTGSLRMSQVGVTPQDPLGVPPAVTPGPYPIDGSSVKIASAAAVTGSGTFDFSHEGPLRLTVPAAAYEGAYRAEITISVASGP